MEENERLVYLNRKDYKIIENKDYFCSGIDAILLSNFAKVSKKNKVLDIGTGSGIIPILMEAKYDLNFLVAFEIQEKIANMAKRSVSLNALENKITIINDDISNYLKYYPNGFFDVITSNPPYMSNSGYENEIIEKRLARHEITLDIFSLASIATKALKYGGKIFLIHKPDRLVDIFYALRENNIEPKKITLVSSFKNKKPSIVLIEGIKGGKPSLLVTENLIIYDENGNYTKELQDIYYN